MIRVAVLGPYVPVSLFRVPQSRREEGGVVVLDLVVGEGR
jgi:hypothetical protein